MDYLKIWTSFRQVMSPLSDDEKGRLFDAMLAYAETGNEPDSFVGNERFLWIAAKQDIDRTAKKCETLRINASKGGFAKSRNKQQEADVSKSCQTLPNDSKDEQEEANAAYNIKKSNIKKNNNNSIRRFTPPTLEQVTAYCKERNNGVDPVKWFNYYTANGWRIGKNPMKDWKAAVRTWERTSETPAKQIKTVTAQQYNQRDYTGVQDEMIEEQNREMEEWLRMQEG